MDRILKAYFDRVAEIIGDRTPGEKAYDDAVVGALRRGCTIKEALANAGEKCPGEALRWGEYNIEDITAHYEYLREHDDIVRLIRKKRKK